MGERAGHDIAIDKLPMEGDRILDELGRGNMVIARAKNDFLYLLESQDEFQLFSHTPGMPEGGRKQFPKDEKHTAIIRNLTNLVDALFLVEYRAEYHNIFGVMASAEDGILAMFPGDDRDADADVEFIIPDPKNIKREVEGVAEIQHERS
ncbi:MAG: hypothetical protein LBT08_08365 [Synergistaceae bacterium]|nr:hypothetical protein [Synergistaceae bacterium]